MTIRLHGLGGDVSITRANLDVRVLRNVVTQIGNLVRLKTFMLIPLNPLPCGTDQVASRGGDLKGQRLLLHRVIPHCSGHHVVDFLILIPGFQLREKLTEESLGACRRQRVTFSNTQRPALQRLETVQHIGGHNLAGITTDPRQCAAVAVQGHSGQPSGLLGFTKGDVLRIRGDIPEKFS